MQNLHFALFYSRATRVALNNNISNIEHKDYNEYIEAKLKLFEQTETAIINLNTDDLDKVLCAAKKSKNIITFGNTENADVYGYNIRKEGMNTVFNVRTKDFDEEIILTMPGLFNVENALAAIAVASQMEIPYFSAVAVLIASCNT